MTPADEARIYERLAEMVAMARNPRTGGVVSMSPTSFANALRDESKRLREAANTEPVTDGKVMHERDSGARAREEQRQRAERAENALFHYARGVADAKADLDVAYAAGLEAGKDVERKRVVADIKRVFKGVTLDMSAIAVLTKVAAIVEPRASIGSDEQKDGE